LGGGVGGWGGFWKKYFYTIKKVPPKQPGTNADESRPSGEENNILEKELTGNRKSAATEAAQGPGSSGSFLLSRPESSLGLL